jgi:hypothetical protein
MNNVIFNIIREIVEPYRLIACCITNATGTHSEYVMLIALSTAKISRKLLNVKVYVRCLSCPILNTRDGPFEVFLIDYRSLQRQSLRCHLTSHQSVGSANVRTECHKYLLQTVKYTEWRTQTQSHAALRRCRLRPCLAQNLNW